MRNSGRPSYPCPPLPQEIIDLIVEQLGLDEDVTSLFACSTVSKAFLPMARACLWRDRFLWPYRDSEKHGFVKWTIDKIPESPILRSLVRSMHLCVGNWSVTDLNKFWEDFSAVVDALQRVEHVELDLNGLGEQIVLPPVIRKWHIVSLKLPRFPLMALWNDEFVCSTKSCAFFENFPMLADVELEGGGFSTTPMSSCTMERHHNLPAPTSLTLCKLMRYSAGICTAILAGHLFSLKRLHTLEIVNSSFQPESLLAVVSNTIKELNIDFTGNKTPVGHWEPFFFGTTEAILFSVDAMHGARETLVWWTQTINKNTPNNVIRKVTIEIQLYLECNVTAPKIRFPKVWKDLGNALLGLTALKDLVIIHRLGYTDRIHDRKDAAIRAGVSKFLRRELSEVTGSRRVELTVIDRNV